MSVFVAGATDVEIVELDTPVVEIPGAQHLATATEPIAVADALLELERTLVESA